MSRGVSKKSQENSQPESQAACRGRGRPRCDEAHQKILQAAYDLVVEVGFNDLTIEGVAAKAGVGKPTIYRRWTTKARLVMDAFLAKTNEKLTFPETGSVREAIALQMYQLVDLMNSPRGQIIATIIGGGQTDTELLAAYRENWLLPRRELAKQVIIEGIEAGELRDDIDVEVVIDVLYSSIFYRLLLKHAPLTREFVDALVAAMIEGLAV
ncbi:MAG: TetR/AcrR family transcriptional regulator [Nostochopsis sp.]